MKISIGDLIDRLTILQRKIRYCKDENIKQIMKDEKKKIIYTLGEENVFSNKNTTKIFEMALELMSINADIWNLESEIRNYQEINLGLVEVGKRGLKIRDLNKIRIEIKNKINELTNSGFKEIKIEHRSDKK